MDTLTFIAEVTKALAWPLAAVAIAVIFRRQIQASLASVRTGKLGPAEFEFEQGVRELEVAAQSANPDTQQALPPPSRERLSGDPRTVILEAWLRVEAALEELARQFTTSPELLRPGRTNLAESLAMAGHFSPSDLPVYRSLRLLRNQAAHETEFVPSVDSVVEYVKFASQLEARIRQRTSAA